MTIDASMVKRLVNQTGISIGACEGSPYPTMQQLLMFAKAVAAYEREECANVCERNVDTVGECPEMAGYCADAVRMRSKGE